MPVGQVSAPILAASLGTGPVALIGGAVAAVTMLLASHLPSLRRIEVNHDDGSAMQ